MKNYVLFFTFILWHFSNFTNATPTDGSIVKSGYYEIPGTNAMYKYHRTWKSWDDAVATCATEGASLYYAENEREFNTVIAYWTAVRNDFERTFFVGIRRYHRDFITLSGKPMSKVYQGWLPGEPNNVGGKEDCVEAQYKSPRWGHNDVMGSKERTFICKVSLRFVKSIRTPSTNAPTEGNIGLSTGYRVIPNTNAVYKYHDKLSVWDAAAATCAAEGASLYYAENKREFETVITYWRNLIKDFPRDIFIGIRKRDRIFKTMTGTPIANIYNIWAPSDPNNEGGNEDCVEAVNWRGPWEFRDKPCSFRRKFICKAPMLDKQCSATFSIGYKYFEPLGRCYKVHRIPKTWTEAQAACKAEGSDLAVINSIEEAAHLVKITNKINDVPGNFMRGSMLLGFYKQKENWYTVQGQPMPSKGYPCWGNQQPDGQDAQQCGAMFHNGRLTDVRCDRKALFICEHVVKDPNVVTEPKSELLSTFECDMLYKNIFSYYPFFK